MRWRCGFPRCAFRVIHLIDHCYCVQAPNIGNTEPSENSQGKDKDYFVLTTNVDHCFQKVGFDKHRLFYTQGDYGLWQCSRPCHDKAYDNQDVVRQMVEAQGFQITDRGLELPAGNLPKMSVPAEMVPHCPKCGAPMAMNLIPTVVYAIHHAPEYIKTGKAAIMYIS